VQRSQFLRAAASMAAVMTTLPLAGCGGGGGSADSASPPPAPAPAPAPAPGTPPGQVLRTVAYVANYESADISIFGVAESGALTSVGTVSAGAGTHHVAVHPSGRFAYAVNELDESISLYSINAGTGMLAPLPTSRVAAPGPLDTIQFHPSGKFAYVNLYDNDSVGIYTVDPVTGLLNFEDALGVAASAERIAIDPLGRFLFVALGDSRVLSFAVDATTGRLNLRSEVTEPSSSSAIGVAPSGRFLYVAIPSGLLTRPIAADGQLGVASLASAQEPRSISIDAAGRLVCVTAGVLDQGVSVYAVEDANTGLLRFVASANIGDGLLNSSAISPSGRTVYAITSNLDGGLPGTLAAFAVDEGAGELTEMTPSSATGIDPFGISIVGIPS